jgi:hypothetical protein
MPVQVITACYTENKVPLTFQHVEIDAEAEEKNEQKINESKVINSNRFNLEMILIELKYFYFNKYCRNFIKILYIPPEVND